MTVHCLYYASYDYRPRDIKQFVIKFLRLQELLQPRNRIQLDKLPALCQDVLQVSPPQASRAASGVK